jgi:Uma2 family endonuclease
MIPEAFDLPELQQLAHLPEITLDVYKALPEDICMQIEVVDGWLVRCESAEPTHQTIQRNLANHLWAAVKSHDARKSACHRVNHDVDVLFAEAPKLHFRRPDVVVYRCIDADRGKWGRKPYASDCVIVVEIVSADSVATDLRAKRAEYAAAGIPQYWIARMTDNDGPSISVERFLLTLDGNYISAGLAVRGRDFHAVDTIDPFPLKLTWDQLDDGM